jgi:hypothetical protein
VVTRITSPVPLNQKGRILNVMSYGINMYDNTRGVGTTHAEANAINNLPPRPRNRKHLKRIDILVIRTSQTGKIGMSKPCIKCIIDMTTIPPKRGYIIKNVSYSNSDGNIVTTSLNDMVEEGNYHVTRFYKMNNFKHPMLNACSSSS